MKCLNCYDEVSDDYFIIDCKHITNGILYTVPTYILCPHCYNLMFNIIDRYQKGNKNEQES